MGSRGITNRRVPGAARSCNSRRCASASLLLRPQPNVLVVSGMLNKQIAIQLGTSDITVKAHRGKVMRQMLADSLDDLIRMAPRLNLPLVRRY
jgi:FixJ family two-component response regulator